MDEISVPGRIVEVGIAGGPAWRMMIVTRLLPAKLLPLAALLTGTG